MNISIRNVFKTFNGYLGICETGCLARAITPDKCSWFSDGILLKTTNKFGADRAYNL
jgi:hypothetical protein